MYEYRATILRVVDGDTVHADVDLGCDVHVALTLRLAGIDAPEHGTPAGDAATAYLRELLVDSIVDGVVTIRTQKDRREKYGRYLATVAAGDTNVNDAMIAAGHAVLYRGGRRT